MRKFHVTCSLIQHGCELIELLKLNCRNSFQLNIAIDVSDLSGETICNEYCYIRGNSATDVKSPLRFSPLALKVTSPRVAKFE